MTIATLSSCSKDDDSSNNQIVGEWKLTKSEVYGINSNQEYELFSTDHSSENIIYNFQSNGTLMVSGGENTGYPNGEYEYFFGEDYLGGSNDPKVLLVKINNSKWTYNLTNGEMKLGQSYVDGVDLIFERK